MVLGWVIVIYLGCTAACTLAVGLYRAALKEPNFSQPGNVLLVEPLYNTQLGTKILKSRDEGDWV